MQEEHAVVVGDGQQRAEVGLGLLDDLLELLERWLISRIEMPAPGRASRSRWASSRAGKRQNGRTGRKIVDALFHVRFLLSKTKSTRDESDMRIQV